MLENHSADIDRGLRNGTMNGQELVEVIRGNGFFLQEVPRGSQLAQTIPRMPRPKTVHNPRDLWVNMGAGGLGDALLGLCAIKGLKAREPDRDIVYAVNYNHWRLIAMFDGGYDGLAIHIWDEVKHDIPPTCNARDLQINIGYEQELDGGAEITRLERYCRNLGWVTPQLPTLRKPEDVERDGKSFHGCVVLAPFSAQRDRDYPLQGWLSIERALGRLGYRVVILGARAAHKENKTELFKSEVVMDSKPATFAGIIKNAACVVANDSGPAHLAGIMGAPTVVLCGWSIGDRIYDFYPRVKCLQGRMTCNGCWTKKPEFDKDVCNKFCANLCSIEPERVVREVLVRVNATPEGWP